jgi:Flp pilus assembly protein TadG
MLCNPINRRGVRRRRIRGSALIEMIFCVIVLFYLVMGGVEFGFFMFSKHVVQAAARDGCRKAIVSSSTQAETNAAIAGTMNSAGFTSYTTAFQNASTNATITDVGTVAKGTGVKVTVSMTFGSVNVRPLGVIPTTKAVIGVTSMIKE